MEVNSEIKMMRAELVVGHLWSQRGWGRRYTGQDYYHWWTRLFLWLAVVCYLPIFKSLAAAVSATSHCAVVQTLRIQFAEEDQGCCSCTTMPDFMRCMQLRRQFGTQMGTSWSPALKAQISPRAIFTSSVRRQNTLLTVVCRTVNRLNVRCRCCYDYTDAGWRGCLTEAGKAMGRE
jgi:hypothetical protein